ncbi:MAG: trehalase family glycosidase, partial [Candidatus Saccharimonadales bacterium]
MSKQKPLNKHVLRLQEALSATKRTLTPIAPSPDESLGELFRAIQLSRIYPDGKTFVDKVPSAELRRIVKLYEKESQKSDFNLTVFADEHFKQYATSAEDTGITFDEQDDPEIHIKKLWDVLSRNAPTSVGSLLSLPKPYIVPGGRFGEQYYWDSYFTMLGLEASGR